MKRVYTAAVVGGGAGGNLSMAALAASERFELAALADISPAARAAASERYPGIQTFADHRQMLASAPVDVVCVATWPPSHLEVTQDALALPLCGILVEKPLADTAASGRQVLELIKARGLPMAVPHGLLVADHSKQVLELVRSGAIGELKLVEIQCSGWDIINAGIHWLDFFVTLTEQMPVAYVMAACDGGTRTFRDGMQVETLAVTYAQTHAGVRVVMQTGDYVQTSEAGKDTLFRLIGTQGTLDFYGWEPRYRLLNADHPQGQIVEVAPGPRSAHQRHLENLAEQMDRGVPDYSVAEGSLLALEMCEAAYLSCRSGGVPVTLPLAEFSMPSPVDWQPGLPYSGEGGGRNGRTLPPKP
ncbi:MAG: Gfo/Idh/MocA family oxidoreductase [Caldilineaceae bacterium]